MKEEGGEKLQEEGTAGVLHIPEHFDPVLIQLQQANLQGQQLQWTRAHGEHLNYRNRIRLM
jgi:hypothetical protein